MILLKESNDATKGVKMILLKESNDPIKGVRLCYISQMLCYERSQITLLVGSFDPFKVVILGIADYILKCVSI